MKIIKPTLYYILKQKINQDELYTQVSQKMQEGNSILLCPEGVSHDQMTQLPFKAGIVFLMLQANKNWGSEFCVLPIGLNYYKRD